MGNESVSPLPFSKQLVLALANFTSHRFGFVENDPANCCALSDTKDMCSAHRAHSFAMMRVIVSLSAVIVQCGSITLLGMLPM
jgi:hypothetical protein